MNSIVLTGFRPRDGRYGIVRVVGRHVLVAVGQILLLTHEQWKRRETPNCDETLATVNNKNLAANALSLHFGLCWDRRNYSRQKIREKEIVSWLVRSAAGSGMGWQSPNSAGCWECAAHDKSRSPWPKWDSSIQIAQYLSHTAVRASFKANSLPSVSLLTQ